MVGKRQSRGGEGERGRVEGGGCEPLTISRRARLRVRGSQLRDVGFRGGPPPRQFLHVFSIPGPIVKGRGVEVSAVRPYEGMDFRVYLYLFEQAIVLQRSVQFADKYRLEIDDLFLIVIENHPERIWPDNLILHYSVYWDVP